MKTKECSINDLYKQICDDYGEWLEMGLELDSIALSLLHKERERNKDLQMKINRLERELNS
jgi:hypothetical protein